MPYLTLSLSPDGPIVDIVVGISQPRRDALQRAGQPIPPNVAIRGLVDTGASCTCVDGSVLSGLNLTPTGSVPIHTPSTGTQPHLANQYDVTLVLRHPDLNLIMSAVAVVESHLGTQGIQALIGRDVLENCLFVYDGREGTFVLAF